MRKDDHISAASADENSSPLSSDFFPFQHHELLNAPTTGRALDQKKLVNKLNHLNFIDSFVFLVVREKNSRKFYLLKAYPQPCVKDELLCRLSAQNFLSNIIDYSIEYLLIDDGLTATLATVNYLSVLDDMIKLSLPEQSHVKILHKTRRYYCKDIACTLVHDNLKAQGILIDFTPTAFSILLDTLPNAESVFDNKRVELTLSNGNQKLFTGPCNIIRNSVNSDKLMVLTPDISNLERFPKRNMRNPRHVIKPSFVLRFNHPLFQKKTERDIKDISTAGFSIIDTPEEEVLMPGLHIPEATIIYAGVLKIPCSVQVLYRREDENNNCIYFGLAITDMDLKSYTNLNHILGTYVDSNARVSTEVDMDALWEFFFDTGFIYGEKYEHLSSYRHDFKYFYQKLYQDNLDVARHFVYEKNGKIYGHISMVHAYNHSWLIHHFSARRIANRLPGPSVLRQIIHYTGSYSRLQSSGMSHVMTYYQPNNRIIDRIFGAFTRQINDPSISSLDVFSYVIIKKSILTKGLEEPWNIKRCSFNDVNFLNSSYHSLSGGLMINAFGLDTSSESLKNMFLKSGFKRNYDTYCLFYQDKPNAFFIINQSDLGLNLSDLLNSIKVIILDQTNLPWSIMISAISNFAKFYTEEHIPVLFYPTNYLSSQNIKEEKKYALWILQAHKGSDDFLQYTNALIKV